MGFDLMDFGCTGEIWIHSDIMDKILFFLEKIRKNLEKIHEQVRSMYVCVCVCDLGAKVQSPLAVFGSTNCNLYYI